MARTRGARSTTGGTGARYRIWQTMRVFARNGHPWTVQDMAAVCETTTSNVRRFVGGLVDCRYVEVKGELQPGIRGGDRVHILLLDTGPEAPRLRLDGSLWDPNLRREIVPAEGAGDD